MKQELHFRQNMKTIFNRILSLYLANYKMVWLLVYMRVHTHTHKSQIERRQKKLPF